MTQADDDFLLIGTVINAFGIRGELKVRSMTDRPEHLRRLRRIYLGAERRPVTLRRVSQHKPGVLLVGLNEVATREQAEALAGAELFIRESEAAPLDEGEYFIHQLIDLTVVTVDGRQLGRVAEVLSTGSNDVLVVKGEQGGEVLIPMIKDVVRSIDIAAKQLTIDPLPGLL